MTERRIKAVATVSAVDVGAATRKGWDGKGSEADLLATLDAVAKQRSAEAPEPRRSTSIMSRRLATPRLPAICRKRPITT